MKKTFAFIAAAIFLLLTLTGCYNIGEKNASITIIYGFAAVISLLLLVFCCHIIQQNRVWIILLFSSVFIVNAGYTLLAVSTSLEMALWANRVSYLGSVFLPLTMLMIILNVTNTRYKKFLPLILLGLALTIFVIAASPGILTIYYEDVSFEVVDGVSTLVKVYGPLHPIYLVYLLGYFSVMVAVIIRSSVKKRIATTAHAVILAIAVLVNIVVWFIEQISDINFEFLSVSYIISELFLIGVHLVVKENQRLHELICRAETLNTVSNDSIDDKMSLAKVSGTNENIDEAKLETFIKGLDSLTATEKTVYNAYTDRFTTKEIMANLNITENTLKYHNKNIYSKLGVSSRKELMEIYKHLISIKNN